MPHSPYHGETCIVLWPRLSLSLVSVLVMYKNQSKTAFLLVCANQSHYHSRLTRRGSAPMTVSPDLNGDLDGYISICGYGSLLSEKSARVTFPHLTNFRIARLTGFRRLFSVVGAFFFTHRIANLKTEEIAALSVEPCDGETIIVTVFDIKKTEIPAFIEREREYRFLSVVPESLDGKPLTNPAVLCASYTDEEFFKYRCSEGREMYFQKYGEYKNHKIWRDDALPCRVYLRHCVLAAKSLGDEAYNNFLEHTFLADRRTTIRQYFEKMSTSIMEEEPPESLKIRYGG